MSLWLAPLVAVAAPLLPAAGSASSDEGGADIVFHGGTVVTMDSAHPRAEAVAIENGRIVAVGDEEHVLRRVGPDTAVIDFDGRTILPGFVDAHNHLFNDAAGHGLTLEQAQALALTHGSRRSETCSSRRPCSRS